MSVFDRPGAFRYLLVAAGLRTFSKGFEAMGDKLYREESGSAALPYHLFALVLLVAAIVMLVFALKRLYDRIRGRHSDGGGGDSSGGSQRAARIFADDDAAEEPAPVARSPAGPPAGPAFARRAPAPGGFGRKRT